MGRLLPTRMISRLKEILKSPGAGGRAADRERPGDELTGLIGRRGFVDALERELHRTRRERRPLCVLLLDLDRFEEYNRRLGRNAGDNALRAIAIAIVDATRRSDLVARLGGEEFAVLIPGADTANGMVLAERVRRAIEIEFSGQESGVTASCGVASHPDEGYDAPALLAAAARALATAKEQGPNAAASASRASERPAHFTTG